MIRKFSCYEYEVREEKEGFVYVIFDPDYKPTDKTIIREADEWFESEGKANLAAIGHISLLENGEG